MCAKRAPSHWHTSVPTGVVALHGGAPRCLHGLHADDHFRDGSGFRQRVRPLAQGTARGDPHNRGSRSRHQPDANAINSAQVHTVRPRRLTPQGADAPEGVSSPLRPSHLASPAPLSPRHASLTLRFHLRPASACSSTPPHSETPLCPRLATPFLPCPQAEYDRKIREQEDLSWYVSLLCCAGAGQCAGWLLVSFGIVS